MSARILLCSDLDRTILPNGSQPESAEARPRLRVLAARPECTLAYVSGRHEALLREAIEAYDLPLPDYAIGDVGTTIYQVQSADRWIPSPAWAEEIAPDWAGLGHADLAELLDGLDHLEQQEPEKQNRFKLSYYAPQDIPRDALLDTVRRRLDPHRVRASLIWSVDEAAHVGLLDVLPASATKLHAIRFLMRELGFDEASAVFAGDSGNDLPVLTSGLQSVLVHNAREEVREEALRLAPVPDRLYVARGGFLGMNGNYAAGVLEGVSHFIPEARAWLEPVTG